MLKVYRKSLDPDIELILPVLLKKASDTNVFISGRADSALQRYLNLALTNSLCDNLSKHKVLAHILKNISGAKNPGLKFKTLETMNRVRQKLVNCR